VSPLRERIPQPGLAPMLLTALGLTGVAIGAGATQPAAAVPQSALLACASIAADVERLACYDRLTGRAAPSADAQRAMASPAAAVPAVAATPPPVAVLPVAAASSAAPVPVTPVPPPKEAFGLYEAEHPQLPPVALAASLEARVVALERTAGGRMNVSLEGGAVWELDEADPLLAIGETVTITRAAFRSYIMHTPTRRTHRVRRVR
jgi:hypothetical protein